MNDVSLIRPNDVSDVVALHEELRDLNPTPLVIDDDELSFTAPGADGNLIRSWQKLVEVPMDRDKLLRLIRDTWNDFSDRIAPLPDDQLAQQGAQGDWSVKDVMAHTAWWERRMLRWIEHGFGGDPPEPMSWGDVDRVNATTYEANRDRPLADVRAEWEATHAAMDSRVASLSDDDVARPDRFPFLEGEPLWIPIAHNTFDHYPRHLARIAEWLERTGEGT